ncbi:four helix bundle protein [Ancylomarina euxinus]|uniref:Four helix bundle protein n=1 Tax=Ancylomarina euxinus TaxID=2283627 RepID=A0A425Y7M3_9BACT|nr:four helix bundle protein [Ancylomarina euxinus]MCZ4693652.1 four helix bundle protein [Ancylomarina euxinus]MUP13881.1 four helix bundle protein [Ancylomarina euxinus]RRG24490.1 four helix bundle protein [Ancylomarina euxinus]
MEKNLIQEKSYQFSIRIIKLYQYLKNEKKEYVLSKQILRCGTSIGANTEEAIGGSSQKDFVVKLNISYKEARETHYWLRLLKDTDYIDVVMFDSLIEDCESILKILYKIIETSRLNMNKTKIN